jgi:hypothetical protein
MPSATLHVLGATVQAVVFVAEQTPQAPEG